MIVGNSQTVISHFTLTDAYHLGGNDYSFDALQAYCFGINLKL